MARKVKITWVRGTARRTKRHERTIRALGLHRLNETVVHEATPQIEGMIRQVGYLLRVEESDQ
ncbi:50S ribosomal protein L30 [Candidatus Sumerlaeota bacterium]|nr:50S ribosomal protein L30 [Candidatus Sumerlaeota bacterium]